MSVQSALSVGKAIASAVVDPLQQTFQREELELLPAEADEAYGMPLETTRDRVLRGLRSLFRVGGCMQGRLTQALRSGGVAGQSPG